MKSGPSRMQARWVNPLSLWPEELLFEPCVLATEARVFYAKVLDGFLEFRVLRPKLRDLVFELTDTREDTGDKRNELVWLRGKR